MPRGKKPAAKPHGNGANLGFEPTLWAAADKLRNNMDAAEYKHVVLGLIFLKYISDAFEERHASSRPTRRRAPTPRTATSTAPTTSSGCPRRRAGRIFRARPSSPPSASSSTTPCWPSSAITQSLKGVLPKDYARPALDKQRLGELIDLIGTIGLGDAENRSKDILGRVYEYFLANSPAPKARRAASSTRPAAWSACWSRCSRPTRAASTTPAAARAACSCRARSSSRRTAAGSATSASTARSQTTPHGGWRKMNLAIRGIEADLGAEHADSFRRDLHPDLKADYVLANPPFNDSDWGGERLRDDARWKFGTPPVATPTSPGCSTSSITSRPRGIAGFVLANGCMSSNQSGEGEIRKAIIEADLVDCMVALPGQLFYATQIPVCLWFLARNKKNGRFRDRRRRDAIHRRPQDGRADRPGPSGSDGRGYRAHRRDVPRLARRQGRGQVRDVPGFCKAATTEEIAGARLRAHAGALRRRRRRGG